MQTKEVHSREEISSTFRVMSQIYKNLNEETYVDDILNMMQRGYKLNAIFEDPGIAEGHCIGIIGIRISRKLQHGKVVEVEDFMIDKEKRHTGVGKMLIHWAEWQAAIFDCNTIIGTLETKRLESQKIFSRESFIIDGVSFKKSD